MLMPRTAVISTVMTTKMIDLTSGAASPPRFMAVSPEHHLVTPEQWRGQQAAPGRQRRGRPAEGQAVQFGDEFALRRRPGHAARPAGGQQSACTAARGSCPANAARAVSTRFLLG